MTDNAGAPDTARRAAALVISKVLGADAYANLELPKVLQGSQLSQAQRQVATDLCYGTLRQQGFFSAIYAHLGRPLGELDVAVQTVLLLGAYEALLAQTPPHAAVNEAVKLSRWMGAKKASGLVNALMRKVVSQRRDAWVSTLAPGDSTADFAIRYSHPEWIVAELSTALHEHDRGAELADLLAAQNKAPETHLAQRPGFTRPEDLPELKDGAVAANYSPYGFYFAGNPGQLQAVQAGRVGVQDEGSQLAALALAQAEIVGADRNWLDLCAGPGGKSALLGALAVQRHARLTAVELHPHRANLVAENLRFLRPEDYRIEVADGREYGTPGSFDRVMVDAPCTGLGALRRRPEARFRKRADDIAQLVELQQQLLARAIELVRPGGLVAYVTCSPVVAETVNIWRSFDLVPVSVPRIFDQLTGRVGEWGHQDYVQLWPHVHGTDAMFIAVGKKR